MTVLDDNDTLADLVTARPALAPLLDELGLDYCCGGRQRLADAVKEAGLDLDKVTKSLGAVDREPEGENWSTMTLPELVDHLESTHHAYLHDALPRLGALVDKVARVHGARHPELAEVHSLYGTLRADLEPHLMKEERVLFPMVRELAVATTASDLRCGSPADPIQVMLAEHDTAGDLLARLRSVTDAYTVPDDGCASYRALYAGLAELEADTHLHVHKENNLLFPAVLRAERNLAVVADIGEVTDRGPGAVWSLPHGGDLDANLVRLKPDGRIGEHVNDEVDVLIFVQTGSGILHLGGDLVELSADRVVLIPKGSRRAVFAGGEGLSYLSVHRARGSLRIGSAARSSEPSISPSTSEGTR